MSSCPQQRQKERARKSAAAEEEDDRISALPDALIAHILSLVPSTQDAIRTGVLSKRWRLLWTQVPSLFFLASELDWHHRSHFGDFVNDALKFHSSSRTRIQKFVIRCNFCDFGKWYSKMECNFDDLEKWGSKMDSCLRYVSKAEVKELTLDLDHGENGFDKYSIDTCRLPQFLYHNNSLIELDIKFCDIVPNGKISWSSLKILSICCANLEENVIETILSGSPVLESLELNMCMASVQNLNVTSRSLKRLVLNGICTNFVTREGLSLEISAPNVEDLEILGSWRREWDFHIRSIYVPSLISCTLDFQLHAVRDMTSHAIAVEAIVGMVRHAKKLKIGRWLL